MSVTELSNDMQVFGEQLKVLRKNAEMSQDEVAERSSLRRNQIIAIEKGTGNPTMETIFKYLDAVGGRLKAESQW